MRGSHPCVEESALEALEREVARALESDDAAGLEVLGWGEISPVLALRCHGGAAACKRLPPFSGEDALEAYRSCFEAQLEAFESGGIPVLATTLRRVARSGNGPVAYCVQPLVEREGLLPALLAREPEARGQERVETLVNLALAYVSPTRGLDAQLSNWAMADGRLVYLDVTTPLLRDGAGHERLDVDVFLASVPWALRVVVKRFVVRSILDNYYSPRGVVRDLLANLVKEGLEDRLAGLVAAVGRRSDPPLTLQEVRSHYAQDARTWHVLQRLRHLDRAWQRRVRRRPYPFLLPGPVQRRV